MNCNNINNSKLISLTSIMLKYKKKVIFVSVGVLLVYNYNNTIIRIVFWFKQLIIVQMHKFNIITELTDAFARYRVDKSLNCDQLRDYL